MNQRQHRKAKASMHSHPDVCGRMMVAVQVSSRKDLSKVQAGQAIEWLEQQLEAQGIPF